MSQQDFTTSFTVSQSPKAVFDAICNVRGWWSENIEGDTASLNSIFRYHYQDVHVGKFKITELSPERIVWHVLENRFKFTKDEHEWQNSNIVFDIAAENGKTRVTFTHKELTPAYECYDLCKDAWTHYIQGSLKSLITSGKGEPTPREESDTVKESSPATTNTISIRHRLRIEVPVETVYHALTTKEGLQGWWTPDVEIENGLQQGGILKFGFGPQNQHNQTTLRIEALHHYDLVKWSCLEANPEWIGTEISFELEPHVKGAVLNFSHNNWQAYTNEFAGCSYAWALFLKSLKRLCETGKGLPFPDFDK